MLRLLAIATGTEPITVEKVTLPTDDRDALKANILGLNLARLTGIEPTKRVPKKA